MGVGAWSGGTRGVGNAQAEGMDRCFWYDQYHNHWADRNSRSTLLPTFQQQEGEPCGGAIVVLYMLVVSPCVTPKSSEIRQVNGARPAAKNG